MEVGRTGRLQILLCRDVRTGNLLLARWREERLGRQGCLRGPMVRESLLNSMVFLLGVELLVVQVDVQSGRV